MTRTSDKLVVVATYNEIDNLPRLVDELRRYMPDADILVIDDNSPDGTGVWCEERARTEPSLRCLHRSSKLGLGTAAIAGFAYSIEHGYDFVATMDADLSHDASHLPSLFSGVSSESGTADVMIGSRYVPGGGIIGWPWHRRWMSWAINSYARWMLRLSVRDCSGAFRCYRISVLRLLDLRAIRSDGYSYLEEILWLLKQVGAVFSESPITFVDRRFGQTKISLRESIRAVLVIWQLGMRIRFRLGGRNTNPR